MKTLLILLPLLFLTACATGPFGPVLLVHPKTGERITCKPSDRHPFLDGAETSACARQYEGLGFVRATDLTPDQRNAISSKPLPTEIHQDITIRQAPAKTP